MVAGPVFTTRLKEGASRMWQIRQFLMDNFGWDLIEWEDGDVVF